MNIEDIKKANAEAGYYFFSPDTLRFFSSRIGANVYGGWHGSTKTGDRRPGGQYFITSERFDCDTPRLYTVRRYNPETHNVQTVSKFGEYKTSQGAAKRAIRERDKEQGTAPAPRKRKLVNGPDPYDPTTDDGTVAHDGLDTPSYGD